MRKTQEVRGDSSGGGIVLAGVLAAVLVMVLFLWMRDREATDFKVEIGNDEPTVLYETVSCVSSPCLP